MIIGTAVKKETARQVPLEMEAEDFRRIGHELVDRIAEHLEDLPQAKVTAAEDSGQIRRLLDSERPLPEQGTEPGELLEGAARLLFEHSLFNGHPRFWGYITASAAPLGMLADLLAAAVNSNVGAFRLSPVATEIEAQTIRWIAELVGFPRSCGGLLTSGGNVANILCFLAARTRIGGAELRQSGLSASGTPRFTIYTSQETHTWIQKAADLTGLGAKAVRWIETDPQLRLRVDSLLQQIRHDREQGFQPLIVIGTAGSVSTGAIDPLPELARICRQEGLWFHVDGAYGAPAAAVPGVPQDLLGLSEADSVAVDPHKWLYAPLEAGCVLVRDPDALREAFSFHPPYYHFDPEAINYIDRGIQNSRGFRALKVWLVLQQAGRSGYQKMISDDIEMARHLFRLLDSYPELEAFTQGLSITTFRYCPPDLFERRDEPQVREYLNGLNSEILHRIERSGEAFLSNAVIRGNFALRLCVVNFRTTIPDIEALPDLVCRIGRQTDRDRRAEALRG